jgi:hypothetical protein
VEQGVELPQQVQSKIAAAQVCCDTFMENRLILFVVV